MSSRRIATVLRVLLIYTSIVLARLRALFRCRSEQAIVELALRQQLATHAHQQTKPRSTPLDRTLWVAPYSPMGGSTEHQPSPEARIVGRPRVGGLHHRYEWQKAA